MDSSQVIHADLIKNNFQIQKGKSKIIAQREGRQLSFYEPNQDSPLGHIYFGSPLSGAIYLGNEIIGEFQTHKGKYIVRPVKNGRFELKSVELDPIDYFFTFIKD
jgi:hypothetical protein